ncbi:WXG100-like domain-containing protein, partial [Streptomyces chartreusis]|uniref:WXG100-like domain-containing protein n=1 Tax=Streptomyces chartreusis TaxID=1969 RepID=UPI003828FD34
MAIEASDAGRGMFLALTGMEFPKLNEDLLRALAEAYFSAAEKLGALPDEVVRVTRRVRSSFDARSAQAFADSLAEFTSGRTNYVAAGQELAAGIGRYVRQTGTQVEYTKAMAIGQLAQLFFEIAWCIANAFRTFGASLLLIPVYRAITSRFLLRLMVFFLEHLLAHVIINTSVALSLDMLIQRIQLGRGTRDSWDGRLTREAGVGGVIEGMVSAPLSVAAGRLVGMFRSGVAERTGAAVRDALRGVDGLGEAAADALARSITDVVARGMDDLLPPLSSSGRQLSQEARTRLGSGFGEVFAGHFGRQLGEGAARDLGEAYGRAFAGSWGEAGAADVLAPVLSGGLGGALPSGVRTALAQLPGTVQNAVRTAQNTVVSKAAGILSEGLEEGATNTIAEFLTTLLLTGNLSTSVWGFVAGLNTGLIAGAGVTGGISAIEGLQHLNP